MIKNQMFIGAALLVGVAIGYFAGGHGKAVESVKDEAPAVKRAVADKGEAASVRALRRRVVELERQLAEKAERGAQEQVAEVAADKKPQDPVVMREMSPRHRRGRFDGWLRDLKEKDPAQYSQITNGMARGRMMQAERTRSTAEFLASVDTSRMSDEAKSVHKEIQELIVRRDELDGILHQSRMSDEEPDEEQLRQLHEELGKVHSRMWELNNIERDNLVVEMAKNLGFDGDDSKVISDTVNEILEATGIMRPPQGMNPRGGGPRGGPRGR